MAGPTLVADRLEAATASNTLAVTITGYTYTAGDRQYMVAWIASNGSVTSPGGSWTMLVDQVVETSFRVLVYYRDLVGGDSTTSFTITAQRYYTSFVVRASAGGALSTDDFKYDTDPGTALLVPSMTSTGTNDLMVVLFATKVSTGATTGTLSLPGSMTLIEAKNSTSGSGGFDQIATEVVASPGATGTRASTASITGTWAAVGILVKEASGGGVDEARWADGFFHD